MLFGGPRICIDAGGILGLASLRAEERLPTQVAVPAAAMHDG
ncbi:MAG TPA: hypothetical protein VIJ96_16715 [Acidothermaceae bacterium]